jgi:hypothetical protein
MNNENLTENKKKWYEIAIDPAHWINHGLRLMLSADLICDEFESIVNSNTPRYKIQDEMLSYSKVYMMLLGLAFENTAKGILIQNGKILVGEDQLKNIPKMHNIKKIISDVLPDLSEDEINLLRRVEEYTKWNGKYPVPLKSENYVELSFSPSRDKAISNKIFTRLYYKYNEPILANWTSSSDSQSIN